MGKRQKYTPHSYESGKPGGDPFAALYRSLLLSDAFTSLSKGAKILYVYCALHIHNAGRIRPGKDFPNIPELQGDDVFYLNRALVCERYRLYNPTNGKSFYSDVAELLEHGLIERISNGKEQKRKSVYKMSNLWKRWKG